MEFNQIRLYPFLLILPATTAGCLPVFLSHHNPHARTLELNIIMAPIVILGSGVIGLTIAHLLAHDSRTVSRPIIIVSRDGVEDLHSQAFASPWAVIE
jgi:uncharacterized NAD(P)/FAD-binding protein YdhS